MAKYSGQLVAVPTFDTADALKVLKYQKYIVDVYNMHHHQHGTHLVTRKAAENEFKKLLQSNYFADKPFRKLEHLDNVNRACLVRVNNGQGLGLVSALATLCSSRPILGRY